MEINITMTNELNNFITDIFDRIISGQLEGLDTMNELIQSEQNLADIIDSTMNDNTNDNLCKKSHFKLNSKDKYNCHDSLICSICSDNVLQNDDIYKCKNCDNIIHYSCMNNWIRYNSICPLCRFDIKEEITDTFIEWIDNHLDF